MSINHPRFQLPQHTSYYYMYPQYRPYIYWINEPDYKSEYVNTDHKGLRYNYTSDNKLIDIDNIKKSFTSCNVIIGGSTVFGVDASSDKNTISFYLNNENVPCINFGNRGAVSFQELILFIQYRELLPKINNVILCTGVNEVSLWATEASMFYDEFGGLFGQDTYMTYPYIYGTAASYDHRSYHRLKLYNAIERRYRDFSWFRAILNPILNKFSISNVKETSVDFRKSDVKKFDNMIQGVTNTMKTWKALSVYHGFNLHYILQPCIGWAQKELNNFEKECWGQDIKMYPSILKYSNQEFYLKYKNELSNLSSALQIEFYDSNKYFGRDQDINTLFTDVCHLTDGGNKRLADYIKNVIKL